MPSAIDISSWDIIRNTSGDVLLILPPIPRPRGVMVALDAVYVVTAAAPVRLSSSEGVRDLVAGARTLVVAEAHEHIVRETLVQVARTNRHLHGESVNDLEAA